MDTNFDNWIDKLEQFSQKVDSSLAEIRKAKAELQLSKSRMTEQLTKGQYYRDEECIIISAPKIIIGNLTKDGTLNTNRPSEVIIRSNDISLEGVGNYQNGIIGTISQKASKIENIGIDPGIDGVEEAVTDISAFSVQASSIALHSEDAKDVFIGLPTASSGQITLSADYQINLDAAKPGKIQANLIKEKSDNNSARKKKKDALKADYEKQKKQVDDTVKHLKELLEYNEDALKGNTETSTNCLDFDALHEELQSTAETLTKELSECGKLLSEWAEVSRQITGLKAKKDTIDKEAAKYKEEGNGTSINITAEKTNIRAFDADNNIQKSNSSGLYIQGRNVDISSTLGDGMVIDQSQVNIHTQNINLSTESPKKEGENIDFPADGNVHILSKNIVMESVDYEMKKGEDRAEKALTKDGSIKMRAENMVLSSYDTEGKASGKFSLNSKDITLKAMDVDKEKLTDKEMAKNSTLKLMSDKIYAGNPEEKAQTQQIQLSADKVGIFAKTTAEMQQDEAKAALQLDGGNIAISGGKTTLYGETTLHGKTTFKSETIQGKATVDNIEIKTAFKSPNTSEGIGVPGSPSTEKISTKLKEEKEINNKEEA